MLNESIKMAIDGMTSNKLRTFLTLLGIIIGVGAVIAMVGLGFGVKENIRENISKLGSNLLIITSGGRTASGARLAAGEGARLTYEDAQAIEKQVDGIANISASVSSSYQLVMGNQNWTSRVEGTTPSNFIMQNYVIILNSVPVNACVERKQEPQFFCLPVNLKGLFTHQAKLLIGRVQLYSVKTQCKNLVYLVFYVVL